MMNDQRHVGFARQRRKSITEDPCAVNYAFIATVYAIALVYW